MFYLAKNMFIGRIERGKQSHEDSIRILAFGDNYNDPEWPKANGVYLNAKLDIVTTASSLASVIASLHPAGATSLTFQNALNAIDGGTDQFMLYVLTNIAQILDSFKTIHPNEFGEHHDSIRNDLLKLMKAYE